MQELIEVSTPESNLLPFLSREPVHIDEVHPAKLPAGLDCEQRSGYDGVERHRQAGRRHDLR